MKSIFSTKSLSRPFLLLSGLFILIRTPTLAKEFTIEEPHIVKAATAIATKGYPKIYMGEQTGELVNLWKPPGLVFALATSFKLFGVSEVSARIVPLLFSLGQLILIFFFATKLFPGKKGHQIATLAGIFFAIHPYSIQTSTQVDIDGGVYAFLASSVMIFAYFASANKFSVPTTILWFILIHFAFTTKFEPTLMLLTLLGIFLVTDPKRRNSLFWIIPTSALSIGAFFLWFKFYNSLFSSTQTTSMPVDIIKHVFNSNFSRKINPSADFFTTWNGTFALTVRLVSWATIPLVLLTLTQSKKFAQGFLHDRRIRFLAIWSLGLIGIYILFGFSGLFPRYFAPAMPAFYILLSALLIKSKLSLSSSASKFILATSVIWTVLLFANKIPLSRVWEITQLSPISRLTLLFLTLLAAHSIISVVQDKKTATNLLLSITLITLIFQSGKDLTNPQALTNGFGQWGNKAAGEFLRENLPKEATIISTDPIGYYYHQPYFDVNLIFPYPDLKQAFNQEFKSVRGIALPESVLNGYLQDKTNPLSQLDNKIKTREKFGTIQVLLIR